jgi:hypothetical protein
MFFFSHALPGYPAFLIKSLAKPLRTAFYTETREQTTLQSAPRRSGAKRRERTVSFVSDARQGIYR